MVNGIGGVISGMLDVLDSVTIRIMRYRRHSNITKLINIRTQPINLEPTKVMQHQVSTRVEVCK